MRRRALRGGGAEYFRISAWLGTPKRGDLADALGEEEAPDVSLQVPQRRLQTGASVSGIVLSCRFC
jgi:hypothetical protein